MIFTNDELRNAPSFDPADYNTWSVSDWETCWAMRSVTHDNNSVVVAANNVSQEG